MVSESGFKAPAVCIFFGGADTHFWNWCQKVTMGPQNSIMNNDDLHGLRDLDTSGGQMLLCATSDKKHFFVRRLSVLLLNSLLNSLQWPNTASEVIQFATMRKELSLRLLFFHNFSH